MSVGAIFTVGQGQRLPHELIKLLQEHQIEFLLDVRSKLALSSLSFASSSRSGR